RGGQHAGDVDVAVLAGAPAGVVGQFDGVERAVADEHQVVTTPARSGDVPLPGRQYHVEVLVRVEAPDHHEVAAALGVDERGDQLRGEVAAQRQHMLAGAGHIAPRGERGGDMVAVAHRRRGAGAPTVEHGPLVGGAAL